MLARIELRLALKLRLGLGLRLGRGLGRILITAKAPGCSYSYSEWLCFGCCLLPDDGVSAEVVVFVVVSLLSPAYH